MKFKSKFILSLVVAAMVSFDAVQADTTDVVVKENIIEAVQNIDIVSLNVLLAEGADIDSLDEAGNTALILASRIGNPRMVKIILAHEPNIDQRNSKGYTALMIASEQGQIHIVEKLLEKGADRSLTNSDGLTAADLAVRFGQPEVAKLLSGASQGELTR